MQYDIALLAEDRIHILREGWKFVGPRPHPPLCEVVAEGWIPRPNGLPSCSTCADLSFIWTQAR
jgi:hypothetical protein